MAKKPNSRQILIEQKNSGLEQTSQDVSGEKPSLEQELSPQELEPDLTVFRPDRDGIRKVLGDLEADVMDYIWDNQNSAPDSKPGIAVREVYEAFRLHRVIAYTTVMSTMSRLARKHLLRVEKVDTAYIYIPAQSREEFIDNFVGRILENLLVSFSTSTQSHLERLSSGDKAEKIDALKNRLDRLRQDKLGNSASNKNIQGD